MADPAALTNAITSIVKDKGFSLGIAWTPKGDTLVSTDTPFYASDAKAGAFKKKSEEFKFPKGKGMPGRIWANKKGEVKDDVQTFTPEQYPRVAVAKEGGLKGCYGFPICMKSGEPAYIIEFFSPKPATEDAGLIKQIQDTLAKTCK